MRIAAIAFLCCVLLCGCTKPPAVTKGYVPASAIQGLTAGPYTKRFLFVDGSEKESAVAVMAIVTNNSKKVYQKFKVHVTVTWDFPPDKVEKDFEFVPTNCFGHFLSNALPGGMHCFSEYLKIPITDDQWRLGYEAKVDLIGAEEYGPAQHKDDGLGWQLTAYGGTKDEALALLRERPDLSYRTNKEGYNLMYLAIAGGDVEKVKALEQAGVPLDDVVRLGSTPLHMAAFAGPEMVQYIAAKKLPRTSDNAGLFPIAYAAMNGKADTVQALIDGGENPEVSDVNGNTAMMTAIDAGDEKLVDYLGSHGVSTKIYNDYDKGPLAECIMSWDNLLDTVYKYDKAINVPSPHYHATPLHHAVTRGIDKIAQWCLDHGADKTIKDSTGHVPGDYLYMISNEMDRLRMQRALQ